MIPLDPPTPARVSADELTTLMTLVREVSDDLHTTVQTVATLQQAPAWVTTLEPRLASLGTPGRPPPPGRMARWWGGAAGPRAPRRKPSAVPIEVFWHVVYS
jgi:hypothetical protein